MPSQCIVNQLFNIVKQLNIDVYPNKSHSHYHKFGYKHKKLVLEKIEGTQLSLLMKRFDTWLHT